MNNLARGVRLDVELGAQLMVQVKGLAGRYKTPLLGMETGKFLLVRKPTLAQLQVPLIFGGKLIVRYASADTFWGFQSSVISGIPKLPELLFIRYPNRLEKVKVRQHRRVDCYIPATVFMQGAEFEGMVTDISAGGCRFNAQLQDIRPDIQFRANDCLSISIPLQGMNGMHTVEGVLRNLTQDNERTTAEDVLTA